MFKLLFIALSLVPGHRTTYPSWVYTFQGSGVFVPHNPGKGDHLNVIVPCTSGWRQRVEHPVVQIVQGRAYCVDYNVDF